MILRVGDRTIEAGPGGYVWLSRGGPHGFEAKAERIRTLSFIVPAGLEEVFKRVSEPARSAPLPPAPEEPPDAEQRRQILAVFEAQGVEFALPPQQS